MPTDQVSESVIEALPLGRLGLALADRGAYLVGGVTRTMFGAEPLAGDDIDVAVDGELEPIVADLIEQGFDLRVHERFGTATVTVEGGAAVDLARTRSERYERPGALPTVAPSSIADDLARRDFSINAIAVALDPPHRVLDPFHGRDDLRDRVLRVLHERSFSDDPTRAIRAARYASRLELRLDPETDRLIRSTDLTSISEDRLHAELRRLAREPHAAAGFSLLIDWGLAELPERAVELVGAVAAEARDPAWHGIDEEERVDAVMSAAGFGPARERERALALPRQPPGSPSEGELLAARLTDEELLLAAAAGASWVRAYVSEWRDVALAIGGRDLIEAGIEPGPAIGHGLAEARRLLLDGGVGAGREEQLAAALEAATATEQAEHEAGPG